MLLQVVTVTVLFNVAYSQVQGTVQSTSSNYCGGSITGSIDYGHDANADVWVFSNNAGGRADVTFSTCNSPGDFTEGLVLYPYPGGTRLGDCYHNAGTGCDVCAGTSLTQWTVFDLAAYDSFYIEIYSFTSGTNSYQIDISCVKIPSTPTPISNTDSPTTMQPTTATPTTSVPTLQPTTNIPTTAIPTTANPTTAPTTVVPTTSQPTTTNPTTAIPTTAVPTTSQPTTATPTSEQLVDDPTTPPTTAADGEAENTMENTSEKGDAKTDGTNSQMDTETLLLIVIIILVLIILIGALACYICFLKHKKKNVAMVNKNDEANDIEIAQMVPIDGPKTKTGTVTVTETGTGTSTANGKDLMRVGSVSLSGERENVTGTNVNVNVTDETDTDNDMYDQDDVSPNINNSPSSFEITPGSKPTAGNIGVDFMDMKDINMNGSQDNLSPGSGGSEGDILNEEENNEDNMDEMYDKENKYKTSGGDKIYQKSGNKITKS